MPNVSDDRRNVRQAALKRSQNYVITRNKYKELQGRIQDFRKGGVTVKY